MKLVHGRQIRRRLYLRMNEVSAYWNYYVQPDRADQKRVVIWAQERTGSTLLEDLLHSSGHFQAYGELLLRRKVITPVPFILGLSKRCSRNFICRLRIQQLEKNRTDPVAAIHTLHQYGFHMLYLKRHNKLKQVISRLIVLARGKFHKKDDTKEEIKIIVDCNEFVELMKSRVTFDLLSEQALQGVPYHRVVYEQDLEDQHLHQETANRIMDYLGLERRTVSTQYKKINATPIENLVINYDELVMCVRENGWEAFLPATDC